MKKIFFAAIALVALASCAKEEFVSVNRQAISFGEAFVDNATRADYSVAGNLKKFYVYGTASGTMQGGGTVNIFDGDEVTGTVGTNVVNGKETHVWNCTETQYWIPGANYAFAAVVDATVDNTTDDVDANGMPAKLHTKLDTAVTGSMHLLDMLYAEATVNGAAVTVDYDTPVNFTFQHLLSKVHFTVTSTAQGDYSHEVTGIKVYNYSDGTYTISKNADGEDTSSWTGGTAAAVEFADINNVKGVKDAITGNITAGSVSNADMLLVPNAADFKVEFTVNLYKSTTKDGVTTKTLLGTTSYTGDSAKTVSTDLVKGNAYNFTIACSVGNPIQFSVTNNPTWNSDIDGDGDVDTNDNVKID